MSEDGQTSEKIIAAQDELSAAFMALKETDPELFARAQCATVYYNGSCGFASSGSQAYVRNLRADRPVAATIRKTTELFGGSYSTSDYVVNLPAGGMQFLGCTQDNGATGNRYAYALAGCQVL